MKHPSVHKFETDGAEGVVRKTWHNMKWNIRIQTIKSKNLQPVPCKPVTSIFERRRAGAMNHIKNTESEAVTTCGDVILHRSNMDDDSMHHRALFCRRWGWAVRLRQLHVLIFGTLEGSCIHTSTRRYQSSFLISHCVLYKWHAQQGLTFIHVTKYQSFSRFNHKSAPLWFLHNMILITITFYG